MRVVEIVRGTADRRHRRPSPIDELVSFVERVTAATGTRPLSDHLWLDLRAGGGDGFIAVTASDAGGPIAMAQISPGNDAASLEAFARPSADSGADSGVVHDVAETAVDAFRAGGGGRLFWWVDDPTVHDERFAADLGLAPVRALHEMRRALPHDQHATVDTRAFRAGIDDAAWLAVNNRAFAAHGEQGGWTHATLASRMNEPWFDPNGFRIHEVDGRLAAFCWTKVHDESDPPIGEIYVIAVDPDFHGRGLGKQLTLAGLDSIAARGITTANLYVDADNEAAVGLYHRLGFGIHRTRRAYAGDLPPDPTEDAS